MKLSDCKPGVRVRVYDGHYGQSTGNITEVEGVMVKVRYDSQEGWDQFYPEQLRKIVPKKDKPEVIVGIKETKEITSWVFSSEGKEVDSLKKNGFSVWLMRGVKKL